MKILLSVFLLFSPDLRAQDVPWVVARNGSGYTYFQSLTGDDADADKNRWDRLYGKSKGYVYGVAPAEFLVENINLLPVGRALDLAMGEGRNAIYLARKGFDVLGVDISEVAVRKAKRLAHENGLRIRTLIEDLNRYQIQPEAYDVILMFYYLQRSLVPQIVRGLKPGGILITENATVDDLKYDKTQSHDFLLKKHEIKTLFKGLVMIKCEERDDRKHATASLIARKPK